MFLKNKLFFLLVVVNFAVAEEKKEDGAGGEDKKKESAPVIKIIIKEKGEEGESTMEAGGGYENIYNTEMRGEDKTEPGGVIDYYDGSENINYNTNESTPCNAKYGKELPVCQDENK